MRFSFSRQGDRSLDDPDRQLEGQKCLLEELPNILVPNRASWRIRADDRRAATRQPAVQGSDIFVVSFNFSIKERRNSSPTTRLVHPNLSLLFSKSAALLIPRWRGSWYSGARAF